MKYAYLGKVYDGDNIRKSINVDFGLKRWLEAIIFAEKPYLADNLVIENPDEELTVLFKMCRFFSAVLRDENPEPLDSSEWSLEFEGKHHSLVGFYLNFVRNIYVRKPKEQCQ